MQRILEIFKNEMDSLDINYHYMTNTSSKVVYPYITGEYSETGYSYEDNANNAEMLLEAWNRGSEIDLVKLKDKIKNHFRSFTLVEDGLAVHISYATSYPSRTNDNELKKLEIHLDITYWEGA